MDYYNIRIPSDHNLELLDLTSLDVLDICVAHSWCVGWICLLSGFSFIDLWCNVPA